MRYALLALAVLVVRPAVAQDAVPQAPYANVQLPDPVEEAAADRLMQTLRCVTCQGQSIADSDAPLAADMRHEVRTRILAGEDPEAIRAWLIERYGDYVSYAPRLGANTWPLFGVPVILIVGIALMLRARLSRRA